MIKCCKKSLALRLYREIFESKDISPEQQQDKLKIKLRMHSRMYVSLSTIKRRLHDQSLKAFTTRCKPPAKWQAVVHKKKPVEVWNKVPWTDEIKIWDTAHWNFLMISLLTEPIGWMQSDTRAFCVLIFSQMHQHSLDYISSLSKTTVIRPKQPKSFSGWSQSVRQSPDLNPIELHSTCWRPD